LIEIFKFEAGAKNSGPVSLNLTYSAFERPLSKTKEKAMWISLREYAREINVPYATLYARWRKNKLPLPSRRVGEKIEVELDFKSLLQLMLQQALNTKNESELAELAQLLLREKK
jgi:hypothetical protein